MENNNTFDAALAAFIASSQDKINENYKQYPNITNVPKLVTMVGKKNVRIVQADEVSRSAWGFVELSTGNILKAASWAAPAKHARGSIYKPETWVSTTSYGPAYLR